MGEVSQRARELLAAGFDAAGQPSIALAIRARQEDGPRSHTHTYSVAARAIDKAIAEERAAIVGWLREESARMRADKTGWDCRTVEMRADAISRGEHHEG